MMHRQSLRLLFIGVVVITLMLLIVPTVAAGWWQVWSKGYCHGYGGSAIGSSVLKWDGYPPWSSGGSWGHLYKWNGGGWYLIGGGWSGWCWGPRCTAEALTYDPWQKGTYHQTGTHTSNFLPCYQYSYSPVWTCN
jgi:hypothetical protein